MNGQPQSTPYRVLARKYRPTGFGELIGQEMGFMVARQVDPTTGIQS